MSSWLNMPTPGRYGASVPLIPSSPPVSGIPKIFSAGPWSANTRMISPNASVTIAM